MTHRQIGYLCCLVVGIIALTYLAISGGTGNTTPPATPIPTTDVSTSSHLADEATTACRDQVAHELGIVSSWGQFTLTHRNTSWRERGHVSTPGKAYLFDCAMRYHGHDSWTVTTLDH